MFEWKHAIFFFKNPDVILILGDDYSRNKINDLLFL